MPSGGRGVFRWVEGNETWEVSHTLQERLGVLPANVSALKKEKKKKRSLYIYNWFRRSKGNCWLQFCSQWSLCDDVLFSSFLFFFLPFVRDVVFTASAVNCQGPCCLYLVRRIFVFYRKTKQNSGPLPTTNMSNVCVFLSNFV